jgi:hypothetical protein
MTGEVSYIYCRPGTAKYVPTLDAWPDNLQYTHPCTPVSPFQGLQYHTTPQQSDSVLEFCCPKYKNTIQMRLESALS